ncbi:uncharacterized protein UTRI_05232 [Ustilago trichophora]|uniref:Uncharacterized protein n=1 Tax=Ustilago trichophora TaxID=86804 RepID=A0A5C3EKK6_9BASI|nr:uncharacterized protein UTRI_05232 [Ustilago trichophora]
MATIGSLLEIQQSSQSGYTLQLHGDLPTSQHIGSATLPTAQSHTKEIGSPQLVRDQEPCRYSTSLSSDSSNSTESLVSALSTFPATPVGTPLGLRHDFLRTPKKSDFIRMQKPASDHGSTTDSEATYVPDSPLLPVSRDPTSTSSSARSSCEYHTSESDDFHVDPLLTAPDVAHTSICDLSIHPTAQASIKSDNPGHHDGINSEDDIAGDPDAFASILSWFDFQTLRPPSEGVHIPRGASHDHVRFLICELEMGLSRFRSAAQKLTEELEAPLEGRGSKLDQLLLASVRRATTHALEAMAMASWYRQTKLVEIGMSPSKAENSTLHGGPDLCAKVLGAVTCRDDTFAYSTETTSNIKICDQNFSAATFELTNLNTEKTCRRNGFESATRDRSAMDSVTTSSNSIRPHTADPSQTGASLSIEDIARARSSTPLHFNRPRSPFGLSQRHRQAHRVDNATRSGRMGCDSKARLRSISNAGRRHATEIQTKSICRIPSLHDDKVRDLLPATPEIASLRLNDCLFQFPSAGPSPPVSPTPTLSGQQTETVRQPKQSLKSLRNLKISLRSAQKNLALTPPGSPDTPAAQQQPAPHPHFLPSQTPNLAKRNASEPLTGSQAIVLATKRPLSLAYPSSKSKSSSLPLTRLTGLVKPLTQLRRNPNSEVQPDDKTTKEDGESTQQGSKKLSLRSLLRVFSG